MSDDTGRKRNTPSPWKIIASAIATFSAVLGMIVPASARSVTDASLEQRASSKSAPIRFAQIKPRPAGVVPQKLGGISSAQRSRIPIIGKQQKADTVAANPGKPRTTPQPIASPSVAGRAAGTQVINPNTGIMVSKPASRPGGGG